MATKDRSKNTPAVQLSSPASGIGVVNNSFWFSPDLQKWITQKSEAERKKERARLIDDEPLVRRSKGRCKAL